MPRSGDFAPLERALLFGLPGPPHCETMPRLKTPLLAGQRAALVAIAIILLVGCFLRLPSFLFAPEHPAWHGLAPLHMPAKFTEVGIDEKIYRAYVSALMIDGVATYPSLAQRYINMQRRLAGAILPPTRFLYIFSAYLWHELWRTGPLTSLKAISSFFSMLLLALAALFSWRLGGGRVAICVSALMAFAPTQIHMSQHALIDGFFAFWATLALWLLWENLERPNRWPWLIAYGAALALMVMTKENAMFAYVGLLALLAANYWLHFGQLTRKLCWCTLLGPLLGIVILVFLCGGSARTIEIFRLLVSKASVLEYAIQTGDGAWYRYLIDLMIVSPVVLLLAIGGVFWLQRSDRAGFYMLFFVAASFLLMANIPYGMNLRYTNMWDLPLRYLAAGCLLNLTGSLGKRRNLWLGLGVAAVCAFELRQYQIFFVQHDLYELVPEDLLRAINILK